MGKMPEDPQEELRIRTVVLVGARDFGRCPLTGQIPAALWPVADTPVLVRLLDRLADEGIRDVTVCCGEDVAADVETACESSRLSVILMAEELTSGTAGCLRDAVAGDPGDLMLVLSGSMVMPPSLPALIDAHRASGAELTMVFNPGRGDGVLYGPPAEIYLCQPSILHHVPAGGYADIKEGLIPSILQAGGTVAPVVLDRDVGNFRDRRGYLSAIAAFLQTGECRERGHAGVDLSQEDLVVRGPGAFVHPAARIYGPAVIADRARVLEGAVVIGPVMIGRDVVLGENSAIIRSTLWAEAVAGPQCEVRESVVGYGARIPDGAYVVERTFSAGGAHGPARLGRSVLHRVNELGESARARLERLAGRLPEWFPLSPRQLAGVLGGVVILSALLWSYWPTVSDLMEVWYRSDEYSSGLLVPFLAAYVVWSRRQDLASVPVRPAMLAGVSLFLVAQYGRAEGLYRMYQSAERLSLILAVTALVLMLLGWSYLKKLAPILLFLCLMLPWPQRVHGAVTLPLQRWSTTSAVFCLELAGYEVMRDGNVIHIGDSSVAVAEACNGLRMITAFFVISGLVVLLARRTWWEKLVLLISSLPIALLCNTLRLAVTAVLFTMLEGERWEQIFHDWGGYAMMPLALTMVVGELWLLTRLTTPPTERKPAVISRRPAQHVADS